MTTTSMTNQGPLAALGRYVGRPASSAVLEVCEMCATPVGAEHSHIVNVENRSLMCACRACYLLFTLEAASKGKYRAAPDRYSYESSFRLDESQWEEFQIPVRIAFFFFNSTMKRMVAFYPSPAGATESTLSLAAWRNLQDANPQLATIAPDVEALLVYGHQSGRFDCYIVPIDACYQLTGIIRRRWKGFDGGEEAWREVNDFFHRLRSRSDLTTGAVSP